MSNSNVHDPIREGCPTWCVAEHEKDAPPLLVGDGVFHESERLTWDVPLATGFRSPGFHLSAIDRLGGGQAGPYVEVESESGSFEVTTRAELDSLVRELRATVSQLEIWRPMLANEGQA
ncbi:MULTISPECIES: DUF6907 domain-containing protein [Streptomyces]|uniref:DUF6907 domain-containing protein n=1 Tax=Streptomyces TaxID=1883 RepID=UPI00365390EF